jgi:hypothetical protein
MVQIFPRIYGEGLGCSYLPKKDVPVPEMAPASLSYLSKLLAPYVKPDNTYTIGVLECGNDIVFINGFNLPGIDRSISNNDRKVWPDIQILPDRSSVCAENLEIETERWRKYDLSPPLARTSVCHLHTRRVRSDSEPFITQKSSETLSGSTLIVVACL